jgi:ankyrin repeat protein
MTGATTVPGGVAAAVGLARAANVAGLRAWLAEGGDPNRHDAEGWTPLLAAAARGHAEAVDLLLAGTAGRAADPDLEHAVSHALPIHFAGHSGSVAVAERLLATRPSHREAVWEINGHTLLLQAVFYGHLDLAEFALRRGANTAATTLRGLGAMEFAQQFQNQAMIDLVRPYERPREAKAAYYEALLRRFAPVTAPDEAAAQDAADRLVAAIQDGLRDAAQDPAAAEATLERVRALVEQEGADVNRLGGPLRQPALVVTVTGTNGSPASAGVAELRRRVADYLLERGADPMLHERHPMGAQAVIRACVFNHIDILRSMGRHLTPENLAAALNEIPVVNGLTALHDSVLRASMVGPDRIEGYLDQIRWAVSSGARWDIEDFSGRTQRAIAEAVPDRERRGRILEALGIGA